ncbi:hypothetical protein FQN52_007017 [Onygenales sp. PD_12]|nr:hypothetical protein FQN52_007017 [Onygenales sp. PD_12]
MANTSSPPWPSSFDPALHLHSELPHLEGPDPLLSESHSEELEAYKAQRLERAQELTKQGIFIQHRTWELSDLFRSDDDTRPETPCKPRGMCDRPISTNLSSDTLVPSSPPSMKMSMAPSPSTSPLNSNGGPYSDQGKRKLEDPFSTTSPKRAKTLGPFLMDDDDDELDGFLHTDLGANSDVRGKDSTPPSSNILRNTNPSIPNAAQSKLASSSKFSFRTDKGLNPMARTTNIFSIRTCSGKAIHVQSRKVAASLSYEEIIAERSTTAPGKAKKSYYGIDIHTLLDDIANEEKVKDSLAAPPHPPRPSIEAPPSVGKGPNLMWTEKYRAKRFKDLIGDERTHRSVLRWLKGWESIVFPGLAKQKPKNSMGNDFEERAHRKVLLLTGPPGLGKTTLAHVCAKQAGYEVLEINASDERSRDIVKGRIRDAVGTENVKGMTIEANGSKVRKAGKPICVVVDEVDGVVSGSGGGGEGGFMKALIDLVMLDQKNTKNASELTSTHQKKTKKGDKFRLLRPLILICNDVYHPSLRPLRTSSIAEIIHVRQASLEKVILRMKSVFEKEGIQCDGDGVRRLCESSWGLSSSRDRRANNRGVGEGDIRGVLVAGEWIAHKFRATVLSGNSRLTRKWIEQHILSDSVRDGGSSRGLGRGGTKDIVERVFIDGAGFPNAPISTQTFQDPFRGGSSKAPVGVADLRKRHAINHLREMVDAAGDYDRCITDCFATYPTKTYQDDTLLSKPNAAYEWLHFHDLISSKVYSNQDWELNPYLSQSVVGFHHLFASSNRQNWDSEKNRPDYEEDEEEHPFSGPRADFAAFEARKQNNAILTEFQSSFSPTLLRTFRSTESIATELIPNIMKMLSPDIKPIVVGGSGSQRGIASVRKDTERALVKLAVRVMSGVGVKFENTRVESEGGVHNGWIYRMEPPLDTLTTFSKIKGTSMTATGSSAPVRYAVRQVLEQEYEKEILRQRSEAGKARLSGPDRNTRNTTANGDGKENDTNAMNPSKIPRLNGPKRDFFGRVIVNEARPSSSRGADGEVARAAKPAAQQKKAWVSFHEGYSNAVRKRVSLNELLSGL